MDRVAAGALLPLAAAQGPLDRRVVERAERDLRDRRRGADRAVRPDERDAADDVVRAPAQVTQRLARGVLVGRLAPDLDANGDERVDSEDDLAGRRAPRDGLAQRVLPRHGDRQTLVLLDDVGDADLERHAEALEDRA